MNSHLRIEEPNDGWLVVNLWADGVLFRSVEGADAPNDLLSQLASVCVSLMSGKSCCVDFFLEPAWEVWTFEVVESRICRVTVSVDGVVLATGDFFAVGLAMGIAAALRSLGSLPLWTEAGSSAWSQPFPQQAVDRAYEVCSEAFGRPQEPPDQLDGAEVLEWAWSGVQPYGSLHSTEVGIHGFALCRDDTGQLHRFSCDGMWGVQQDAPVGNLSSGRTDLPAQYKTAELEWHQKPEL